ncbi:hypothetical protein G9A89_015714 [Geosiphon pyriformis]|nr:hypothetical protein G9A89_015714 [Geosiphon pyriformis]
MRRRSVLSSNLGGWRIVLHLLLSMSQQISRIGDLPQLHAGTGDLQKLSRHIETLMTKSQKIVQKELSWVIKDNEMMITLRITGIVEGRLLKRGCAGTISLAEDNEVLKAEEMDSITDEEFEKRYHNEFL